MLEIGARDWISPTARVGTRNALVGRTALIRGVEMAKKLEGRDAVAADVAARLRNRGIDVSGNENSEALADLLTAVERFENSVQAHGGDLMMDDLNSSEPDDPHFVLPRRRSGEGLRTYIRRIDMATERLAAHPPQPGD